MSIWNYASGKNVDTNSALLHLERCCSQAKCKLGLSLLWKVTLTWCKNGCEGKVDPLVSEVSCSPSAIQVSEKIGHELEGAHLLRL